MRCAKSQNRGLFTLPGVAVLPRSRDDRRRGGDMLKYGRTLGQAVGWHLQLNARLCSIIEGGS
jgi:hypothetical protein